MGKGRDYTVGYGRPPKSGQFQKGKSGNERGRPKGSQNLKTLFEKEMSEKVTVTTSSGRKTVSTLQALLMRLKEIAFKGDLKAIGKVLQMQTQFNPDEAEEKFIGGVLFAPAPAASYEEVYARHGHKTYTPTSELFAELERKEAEKKKKSD